MAFQNKFDKRDYYAFQALWQDLAHEYIHIKDKETRYEVVNTFRDSLIDIQIEGARALRSIYDDWEKNTWKAFIEKELYDWRKENPFEASDKKAAQDELEQLCYEYNYMRYKKILQIIQDSGIGLGTTKSVKTVSRKGYNG